MILRIIAHYHKYNDTCIERTIIKSFCGGCPGGGFFKKSPLELVKGIKRVRSVGWAGLNVKKVLLFLPIRYPLKDPDQLVSAGCRPGPVYSPKRYQKKPLNYVKNITHAAQGRKNG